MPPWCGGVVYLFEAGACPTCFPSDPPTVTDGANGTTWGSALQRDLSVSGTPANGRCAVVHHSDGLGDVSDGAEARACLCMCAHADAAVNSGGETQTADISESLTRSPLQVVCRTWKIFFRFCRYFCCFSFIRAFPCAVSQLVFVQLSAGQF